MGAPASLPCQVRLKIRRVRFQEPHPRCMDTSPGEKKWAVGIGTKRAELRVAKLLSDHEIWTASDAPLQNKRCAIVEPRHK